MAEALKHNLKLIGRYAILRELRRDRYTAAYLALDPVLNREVVIKAVQLRPAPGQDSTGHDRIDLAFTRQAQAAGRLVHPHILSVFDAGRVQNVGYLALERVHGKLLGAALGEGFRPSAHEIADIAARIADAMEYAHARGVPHGHLGASRVYLQEPERLPKVMGFGGWIDTGVTGDFELAATEAMLPYFENELGAEARRKDVRALGALLFLLLTGSRPDLKALRARRDGNGVSGEPSGELAACAAPALAGIAERALELRPEPYATAGHMRDALTAFLWGEREARSMPNAVTTTRPAAGIDTVTRPAQPAVSAPLAARPVRDAPAPRRHAIRVGVLGAMLVALVAIGIVGVPRAGDAAASGEPERMPAPTARSALPTVHATPASSAAATPASASRTSAQTTHFGPLAAPPDGTSPVEPAPRISADSMRAPPATRPFQ